MQKKEIDFRSTVDLSVIIISLSTEKYHTKDILQTALKSMVPAMEKVSFELILVDNSTINDGTYEMAKKYFPDLVYLKRNKIFDFGNNNNYGLKKAKGRYVLFLNNDVKIADNNIFEEMVKWMDRNPTVGAATTSLVNPDGKTLQGTGGSFPDLFRVFMLMTFLDDIPYIDKLVKPFHPMHSISPLGSNNEYFQSKHEQDWITGAFYFARKKALDDSGGFDEDFNAYVEETDLSYRIKEKGWSIWYLPAWKIIHFGSLSYGNENSFIYEMKNIKLFYKKHYSKWQLPVLNLIIKLGCILRMIIFSVFKPNLAKIYAKAIKSV